MRIQRERGHESEAIAMTNLQRRLKKLETRGSDASHLVPHSAEWLKYWKDWLDLYNDDPTFRPRERMPIEAARAIMASELVATE